MARPRKTHSHEEAVRLGRLGGLARGKGKGKPVRYDDTMTIRVPRGLKEWYARRAQEQDMDVSDLVREILQGHREAITGYRVVLRDGDWDGETRY